MHLDKFNKLKSFFLAELKSLVFIFGVLGFYAIIFYFEGINSSTYFFSLYFILFFVSLYLLVRYQYFVKKNRLKDEVKLANERVEGLEREYQKKSQELEDYLIMWTHQMKTPISALELFLKDLDNCQSDVVRAELLQIENYTNMILNYQKLANSNNMLITRVKLDDIISPIIKKYSINFIVTKTKLNYQPILNYVTTDANWTSIQIEQIINNALKYAKGGTISIFYEEKGQDLTIKDDGVGIGKEDIPKIFNKGYSGYNGQLNQKSSGLGLFIVRKVSEKLNQRVTVCSEVKKGASFTITFKNLTKV